MAEEKAQRKHSSQNVLQLTQETCRQQKLLPGQKNKCGVNMIFNRSGSRKEVLESLDQEVGREVGQVGA